jgi:hypothetical protein
MSTSPERLYVTERTKMWRACTASPALLEELDMIEEFGCQILHITADDVCPAFSYTIGVFDTCGKPELITVGLPSNTAQSALNIAVELMNEGIDLATGRHRDIVGDVEVEFRPINPKWLHHIMIRADGYYEHEDVPVLQLIYPDLENHFQDEAGFNEYFRQPILGDDTGHGSLEHDLWASYDDASSLSRWKFSAGPHTSAYLSQTVFDKTESVTYVSHDDNGDWQFLGDKMSEGGGPVLSCLHHPIDSDPTLEQLHNLPLSWYATREHPGAPWQRFEHEPEED